MIRDKNRPSSAPNISLNIHSHVAEWELYVVAVIGTVVQTTVLVYAYYSTYNPSLRLRLDILSPVVWAWYFTLIGTLSVVAGMLGCCYVIEKSTTEERYEITGGGEGHILWLQKGETVNDQVFYSHAIFAKNKRSIVMTSRRNDKFTNPKYFDSQAYEYGTTAASLLSLVGFIVQFMGLRGMHWSIPVAQVTATIIMTSLRAVVRRGLSECPYSQQLPAEYEMDWLATRFAEDDDRLRLWEGPGHTPTNPVQTSWGKMFRRASVVNSEATSDEFWEKGCCRWSIITGRRSSGYEPSEPIDSGTSGTAHNRAQRVVEARKRLGYLTRWPGAYPGRATSVAAAIERVMNTPSLFNSSEGVFVWSMNADVGRGVPETIEFKVENVSGEWKADLAEIEAALSLWMFSVHEDEKVSSTGNKKDGKGAWLRSGKASREQCIRLLGPSVPLSRRDMKWWIGDGLRKVLEVDLSKPITDVPDSTITIKANDRRVVGFGDGQLVDGDYKTQLLSEISIENVLNEEVITPLLPYITASGSNYGSKNETASVTESVASRDIEGESEPRLYLAIVSEAGLDLLFAQEMFSSFMWAFARSPNVNRIDGQTTVHPQPELSSNNAAWKSFTLQNTTLSKLAQSIEKTGLGSLDEVYLTVVPPLSAHGKLPDAGSMVDYVHQRTKKFQLRGHWEKAAEMYRWAFRTCSHRAAGSSPTAAQTIDSDPTAFTKATAALTEFLRSLSMEVTRCEDEKFARAMELCQNLRQLRSDLEQELCGLGDEGVLHNLEWLYKGQGRDVSWNDSCTENATTFAPAVEHGEPLLNMTPRLSFDRMKAAAAANKKDVLGWTPLHHAANRGDAGLVARLVDVGADWGSKDLGEWTPLHYAAANAKIELRWSLLRDRVDVNTQGRDGFSPLHCAAKSDNIEMSKLLIESGANLQLHDNSGKTPLHWAAYRGSTEMVSLMLGYGANPQVADEFGRTPLHLAAMKGSLGVVEVVAKVASDIDARERDGQTAMQMAASNGYSNVVDILLQHESDVNTSGGLQAAAANGQDETVQVFLAHKADVNAQDGNAGNALRAAAAGGHDNIVRLLLEHGADINAQDGHLGNALQAAAAGGHVKVVQVLIGKGADVNSQSGFCGNALQAAAVGGHEGVVQLLLEEGADANAQGGHPGNALQAAAAGGYGNIVKVLLEHGADANVQGGLYGNALQAAAANRHDKVVEQLLEHGVDVNAPGGFFGSALQAAIKRRHSLIEAVLRNHGAQEE